LKTLINSLCGRIAIADMPRGAGQDIPLNILTRNLNILLYMLRFLRSVRKSACRQTLHIIRIFAAQRINQHFLRQGKENRAYQEVCKVFLDAV